MEIPVAAPEAGKITEIAVTAEELNLRRQAALEIGGRQAIERHHGAGRLTVRERIAKLADEGSFREIGTLAGSAEYDQQHNLVSVKPAPYVVGLARIDGRAVAIGGEDFTVRGGTSFGALRRKGGQGGFIEDLAHHYKMPLVNLIDGAGGTVTSAKRRGYVVFPGVDGFERSVELLGEVPVVCAVMGTAAGGPAGRAVITALARLDGQPVGIIANNPKVYGGALDAAAARKQIHFMELCDTFHIPLVFFVDVPGFMVGPKAEQEATLREGMRAVYVAAQLSVPTITLVIRKCYGMAGMATCNKNDIDFKIAWPSGEWGSLPVEGGVAAAFRREIAAAPDPKAREKELETELRAYASAFRTAEAFAVEEIIYPRETRPMLCEMVALAQARLKVGLGPKQKAGVAP